MKIFVRFLYISFSACLAASLVVNLLQIHLLWSEIGYMQWQATLDASTHFRGHCLGLLSCKTRTNACGKCRDLARDRWGASTSGVQNSSYYSFKISKRLSSTTLDIANAIVTDRGCAP
jgi:hypothetical protein